MPRVWAENFSFESDRLVLVSKASVDMLSLIILGVYLHRLWPNGSAQQLFLLRRQSIVSAKHINSPSTTSRKYRFLFSPLSLSRYVFVLLITKIALLSQREREKQQTEREREKDRRLI